MHASSLSFQSRQLTYSKLHYTWGCFSATSPAVLISLMQSVRTNSEVLTTACRTPSARRGQKRAGTSQPGKPVYLTNGCIYHFLGNDLWDLAHQVKGKLNGTSVLVLPLQLFGVLNPQLQSNGWLLPVILFIELHSHPCILCKERMIQEVLDGVPAGNTEKKTATGLHERSL